MLNNLQFITERKKKKRKRKNDRMSFMQTAPQRKTQNEQRAQRTTHNAQDAKQRQIARLFKISKILTRKTLQA